MSVWSNTLVSCIYTLSPLHCGTGQAAGAVDLPIAREAHTGFPVVPATSLKGVARDEIARNEVKLGDANHLFGPDVADQKELQAGKLLFSEARLVAYPMRSLNQPFLHVTCPLVLERLERDLRAFGHAAKVPREWRLSRFDERQVHVADETLAGTTLVLEDLIYDKEEVVHLRGLDALAQQIAELLPKEEGAARQRLMHSLVVIPDGDFAELMERVVPIRARIKLAEGKTVGSSSDSNLWYEEYLPPDCLLVSFVGERRRSNGSSAPIGVAQSHLRHFHEEYCRLLKLIQIGGNETVGYGLCWWTFHSATKNGEEKE